MTFRFRIIAAVLAVVVALGTAWLLYEEGRVHRITLAAGPVDGEAFILSSAIAEVVARHAPNVQITVLETSGSGQNMELLDGRQVDLAAVQANIPPASTARLIAELYPDAFQLVARDASGIDGIAALRGKKIAIPPTGSGQHAGFWFLVGHYGLSETDFEALPMSSESANWAMLSDAVDAVFRVRAPGNQAVRELIDSSPSQLVPIQQAAAMRLKQPALEAGSIPRGSYRGHPPLPPQDLPTAVVQRVLVADEALDPDVVHAITELLFERRRDLVNRTSLAGFIAPPEQAAGTFLPMHEGAERYFSRDEPSFFQENAEPIALIITVVVLLGSGLAQVVSQGKKRRIDRYNNAVLTLYAEIRETTDPSQLYRHRTRLMDILGDVVDDAEVGKVTAEGFNVFAVTWRAVNEAARDRGFLLAGTERRTGPLGDSKNG